MGRIIAVTGGIGAGKSVVSRILRAYGYDVYDCDTEAKRIMDRDSRIHDALRRHIHRDVVSDMGVIDRARLSAIVFSDSEKLARLNEIVHGHVRDDIRRVAAGCNMLFVETAILYQSGLDMIADCVWEVTAPVEIRVKRVMMRNSCTADDVRARIESQDTYRAPRRHKCIHTIVNDGVTPVLPQVVELVSQLDADVAE